MRQTVDADRIGALSRDLRNWLGGVSTTVADEIRTYPTPIPRCDAQFNHLVEQRGSISRLLSELDAALAGGHDARLRALVGEFDALPAFGESVEEHGLRDRIGAALRHS